MRRSFLESLGSFLASKEWISKSYWEEKELELSGRRRITESRTVPIPSLEGLLAAFSALAIAPGAALLVAELQNVDPSNWLLGVAAALLAAPGLVFFLVVAIRFPSNRNKASNENGVSVKALGVPLLTSSTITDSRTETFETPDPTSIEFRKHFTNFVEKALATNGKRRLVLAIDNLDRLDPADARRLWGNLQTFLQMSHSDERPWLKRLWVLLPHDRDAVEHLWFNARPSEPGIPDGANGDGRAGKASAAAGSFLDKTLQISFAVPPPVLSGWGTYLLGCLGDAFPNHKDAPELDAVYRVFRAKNSAPPTPRQLKLFVNSVGALHRQWCPTIPLPVMAYYATLQREMSFDDITAQLADARLPEPAVASLFDERTINQMTVLAFNCPEEQAIELLLRDRLVNALFDGEPSDFDSYIESAPGALHVLMGLTADDFEGRTLSAVSNAAIVVDGSPAFIKVRSDPRAETFLRVLASAISAPDTWPGFDADMARGATAALRLFGTENGAAQILDAISDTKVEEGREDDFARGYHVAALELERLGIRYPLHIRGEPAQVILAAAALYQLADPALKRLSLAGASAISEQLGNDMAASELPSHTLNAVRGFLTVDSGIEWTAPLSQLRAALENTGKLPPTDVWNGVQILESLAETSQDARDTLAKLATNGFLLHYFQIASETDQKSAYAAIFIREQPEIPQPPEQGQTHAGHASLVEILTKPESYEAVSRRMFFELTRAGDFRAIARLLGGRPDSKAFILWNLRELLAADVMPAFADINFVKEHWQLVTDADPDRLSTLIGTLDVDAVAASIQTEDFDLGQSGLYEAVIGQEAMTSATSFRNWCNEQFGALPQTEWDSQLGEEGPAIPLLLALRRSGFDAPVGARYDRALSEHARGSAAGKRVASYEQDWSTLIEAIGDRRALRSNVYEGAKLADGEPSEQFLTLYGPELADRKTLQSDKAAFLRLFARILRKRSPAGLRWAVEFFSVHPDFAATYPDRESAEDFLDELKDTISESGFEDADLSAPISEIAQLLNVERRPTPPQHQGTDEEPEDD